MPDPRAPGWRLPPASELVDESVVAEHFDELEYLLGEYRACVSSAAYVLDEVRTTVETRLLAHLDGLVVAGPSVVDMVLRACLAPQDELDPGRATAAAFTVATLPDAHALVMAALEHDDAELRRAVERGCVLADSRELSRRAQAALNQPETKQRASLIAVASLHDGVAPAHIDAGLRSEDPELVVAAARAARLPQAVPLLERQITHGPEDARADAMRAALVLGSRLAWSVSCERARAPSYDREALLAIAMLGEPGDQRAIVPMLNDAEARPRALWALGFSGRPEAAQACLAWLDDDECAALAAEAFCGITGLSTREPGCWVAEPRPDESEEASAALPAFDDDDLDADLVPPAEAELPKPDAEGIRRWWEAHRSRFSDRYRYVNGALWDLPGAISGLRHSSMRRRHAVALEIAIRTKGRHRVPTSGLTSSQRAHVDALQQLGRLDGHVPFTHLS